MRIVIPHARGLLDSRTAAWGEANHAEFHDVGGDREAYFRLLNHLWQSRASFIIVEQDNLPPDDAVDMFTRCPELWCGHAVRHGEFHCVRFRAGLLVAEPNVVDWDPRFPSAAQRDYLLLAGMISARLIERGYRRHMHYPEALHFHDHRPNGRIHHYPVGVEPT